MPNLLSRFAENAFWMARYMERAENLARILDVNETFAQQSRGVKEWLPIVQLFSDAERFFEVHWEATADTVVHFYVLDRTNPTSIVAVVRSARENARGLRHLISTEMWSHLNVFNNTMAALTSDDLKQSELSRVCALIKQECQTHAGITEGTFFRDQSWYFYLIGRQLERADQTTRLLDIKYHLLLPPDQRVGSPVDVSQWNALLRSVAGYHAFRREHPRGMAPKQVAAFLLFNMSFPRSIALCLSEMDDYLHHLRSGFGLRAGNMAMEILDETRAALSSHTPDTVVQYGLHEFSDYLQRQLMTITHAVRQEFCGVPTDADAA